MSKPAPTVPCPICKGKGDKNGKVCTTCDGSGEVPNPESFR
jgi:DnaJ-class molecular chaperone